MKIKVVNHNPNWLKEFQTESQKLQNQIGKPIKHIHHIGSTSVPGLMAKPIIDMLLEVNERRTKRQIIEGSLALIEL